jgi:two-component system, OmpR family, sensor kinase
VKLPLRIRLALVFSLAMTLVLAGAGWFAYDRVAGDLARNLDQQLRGRAQDLSALVRRGGSLRATDGRLVEQGESFAQLVSGDGRVVDATPPLGAESLLDSQELDRARDGAVFVDRPSVPGLDEPARMIAVPIDGRILVAGATRENRAETLSSLRDAFLIGGPVALLLATFAGYVLAGAALRPIEAMRRRAAAISSASLDERLPVADTRDEVSRLGETLNEMLARLEAGLERERRFVADASHQLRTPLALLTTELELALRSSRSPEELRKALHSATESTARLSRLTDDLLLLARADEGEVPLKAEQTDVADIVGQVATRYGVRGDAEPLVVNADPLRLEQALSNLVDNALRHGGTDVRVRASRENGTVELHVLDDGAGFPEEFLERAFERFSRADHPTRRDGSGLGLAIVQTIARAHGGSAGAANRPGGGADVWLALPLSAVR